MSSTREDTPSTRQARLAYRVFRDHLGPQSPASAAVACLDLIDSKDISASLKEGARKAVGNAILQGKYDDLQNDFESLMKKMTAVQFPRDLRDMEEKLAEQRKEVENYRKEVEMQGDRFDEERKVAEQLRQHAREQWKQVDKVEKVYFAARVKLDALEENLATTEQKVAKRKAYEEEDYKICMSDLERALKPHQPKFKPKSSVPAAIDVAKPQAHGEQEKQQGKEEEKKQDKSEDVASAELWEYVP